MGTQNHKAVIASDVHIVWSWSDTTFPTPVAADVGKVFRNSSTNKLYMCTRTGQATASDNFTQIHTLDGYGIADDLTLPNDLTVTNDAAIGGDAAITGDLTVTGEVTGGTRAIVIEPFLSTQQVAAVDGIAYFSIPAILDGANLTRAQAIVLTAGTTGATTVDIYNKTDSVDMLSTAISIASGATVGTPGTINTSNDDVATDDVIRIDVSSVSTTQPYGMIVCLEFKV